MVFNGFCLLCSCCICYSSWEQIQLGKPFINMREIRRFVKCRDSLSTTRGNWLQKIFGVARGSNPQSFAFTVSCNFSSRVLVKKGAQLRSHKLHYYCIARTTFRFASVFVAPSSSKRFEMTRFDAFYKVS